MQFDPFKKQNSFYKFNLTITKDEINQILFLVKSRPTIEQKTTYNYLNILNFPILVK